MPWTCPKCAAPLTDNLQACPTCGTVKTSWTLNERRTRNLVVARNRLDLLRGEGADGAAGDYEGLTWTATTAAPAVTVGAARARQDAGQRPAARDLLLVRVATKKAAWTLRLTVEFAGKASQTLELPSTDLMRVGTDLELRLLLAYGPEAAALDVPGVRVLDVTEGETCGVTLEVQGPTPRPTRLPIEAAWTVAWADPATPAGMDTARAMTLAAPGLPAGDEVVFEVQREVDGAPSGAPVEVAAKAEAGAASASFSRWFVADGVEPRHLAAGAALPAVAFRIAARAGARRAEAAEPLPYSDTLHIRFLSEGLDAPLANRDYVLHSPWFTRPGRSDAEGVAEETGLPPGGAMVIFGAASPAPAGGPPGWSAAWADVATPVGVDQERAMTLTAPDLAAGEEVVFEVQREVDGAPSGAPVEVKATAEAGSATASFARWFDPAAVEQRHLAAGDPLPAVAFRLAARTAAGRATAADALPYSDTLHIQFLNEGLDVPLANRDYVLHSPWCTRPGRSDANGVAEETGLPPGGAMVIFGAPTPPTVGGDGPAGWSLEWSDAATPVGQDQERSMTLAAPDLSAGEEVVFEVQRQVDGSPSGAPVEVKATSQAGSASATFARWFDAGAIEQRHLAAGAALPAVSFRLAARAGGRRQEAGAALRYSDTLHIQFLNDGLDAPLANRDYVLHSPWFTRPGRSDANGVAEEIGLPPGGAMVIFGAARAGEG